MTEEQERKIDTIANKVSEIHHTMFGVEGQGGIIREHREFRDHTNGQIAELRRHRDEMKTIMAKIFGALIVIGSIASFLGAKIAHWLKIDTTP